MLCPTGPFAHLPVHAAGRYNPKIKHGDEPSEFLFNYSSVSYTPTIGALLKARKNTPRLPLTELKMLVAAVSYPCSRWRKLLFSAPEVDLVRAKALSKGASVHLFSDVPTHCAPLPTIAAVMEQVPKANVLHLACHGYQDPSQPLESGFPMSDGMLTVAKLMSLNMKEALLAFLSACDTAKGNVAQPDQALHLAAAMLFAGFRSVIGTMW